jgi:pyruvate kinase
LIRTTVDATEGDRDRVSTTYKQFAHGVKPGDRLLVDNGNVGLVAVEKMLESMMVAASS